MAHTCDALVVSCIDFRFQKFMRKWLDDNLSDSTYDYVGFAGGTKDFDTILAQLEISVRLHHISKIILIHHEDCGAYGAESTKLRHTKDLKLAQSTISKLYPKLDVDLYYLHLDGEFEQVK